MIMSAKRPTLKICKLLIISIAQVASNISPLTKIPRSNTIQESPNKTRATGVKTLKGLKYIAKRVNKYIKPTKSLRGLIDECPDLL